MVTLLPGAALSPVALAQSPPNNISGQELQRQQQRERVLRGQQEVDAVMRSPTGRYHGRAMPSGDHLPTLRELGRRDEGESGTRGHPIRDHHEGGDQSANMLLGKRLNGAVLGLPDAYKDFRDDLFVGQPLHELEGLKTAQTAAAFNISATL